ncbi:hypothetical protein E2P81_ATG03844 [Venturia nashicola]|nr:hypothetical protein E2P81_ATG03844 [Venturia nashicola]
MAELADFSFFETNSTALMVTAFPRPQTGELDVAGERKSLKDQKTSTKVSAKVTVLFSFLEPETISL